MRNTTKVWVGVLLAVLLLPVVVWLGAVGYVVGQGKTASHAVSSVNNLIVYRQARSQLKDLCQQHRSECRDCTEGYSNFLEDLALGKYPQTLEWPIVLQEQIYQYRNSYFGDEASWLHCSDPCDD